MKHKSDISTVAFGKSKKRIRRERIEKALEDLKNNVHERI